MDKQYYIDNHIGIFKNFMPNKLIDDYLNYFNRCEQQGAVYPRKEDEMLVSDNAIDTIRDTNVAMTYNNKPFIVSIALSDTNISSSFLEYTAPCSSHLLK